MGIFKAVGNAVGGGLADTWLEVVEADNMGQGTVFTKGVTIRKGENKKGTDDTISNGSVIHVYDKQFMLLVDGGKVVDYTAEPGYYTVDNSKMPSLFNGQFGDSLKEAFDRIKFGGQTPTKQQVFFINLQEIKGIKFGTRNPINYFDEFYNAELFLRAHGTYSIKITNPLLFYAEAIPRNASRVDIDDINDQYMAEFLEALQASINQMSVDGIRISYVSSKATELGKYMADVLDEEWTQKRGMEVQSVGVQSISYDEKSQELINMRNQGAMLKDADVREGYVQGAMARGMEAAGSNANGSMAGFMGMGMAMNTMGNMAATTSQVNLAQMQMQQGQAGMGQAAAGQTVAGQTAPQAGAATGNGTMVENNHVIGNGVQASIAAGAWICGCGTQNTGKFCTECGKPAPVTEWTCECGTVNSGKFCSNCGKARP